MAGDGTDAPSGRALAELRETLIPATIGKVDGAKAYVTGIAAGTKDFNDLMVSRAPYVFVFVLALAFVLLLVTFRSIVIPVKAIILNLLSVAAAYGVLTWVFVRGNLEHVLGFTPALSTPEVIDHLYAWESVVRIGSIREPQEGVA